MTLRKGSDPSALPAKLSQMLEYEVILNGRSEVTGAPGIHPGQSLALVDPSDQSLRCQLPWPGHLRTPQILVPEAKLLAVVKSKGPRKLLTLIEASDHPRTPWIKTSKTNMLVVKVVDQV